MKYKFETGRFKFFTTLARKALHYRTCSVSYLGQHSSFRFSKIIKMNNSLNAANRLYGLDTLRALAISLVLMSHYGVVVSHKPTFGFLTDIGWMGVDLFFVLSGYLIGNQVISAFAWGEGLSLKTFLHDVYCARCLTTMWCWRCISCFRLS